MNDFDKIADFFFELSVLKRLPRSGSFIAGVPQPDSVAEHVFRATEIAFVLADLEGANAEHTAFLVAVHDNGEARAGDQNNLQKQYYDIDDAEKRAFFDQCQRLPKRVAQKFQNAFMEIEEQKTLEAKCAKDADLLELAFQSKEFLERGYLGKQNWLDNIEKALKTKSAQMIFQKIQEKSSNDWWRDLKK